MTTRRTVHDLLDRLAAAEESFLRSDFLAPAVRGGTVHVRLGGVVCRMRIPKRFQGWGVFRPVSASAARLVRPATLDERRGYLELLPRRRLILCQPVGAHWLALPAHQADTRLTRHGLLPVLLVEEAERFETVEARWDGGQFWFEGLDTRSDPAAAAYLRQSLHELTLPEQVRRPGLSAEQRAAYALAHALRLDAERDQVEERLRQALAHGGGVLRGYAERGGAYRVEFQVDGEPHVAVIDPQDFSVQVAGVCLSGEDRHFDLQSLVGVIREARGEGVLHVGEGNAGLDEETYWDIHPPRYRDGRKTMAGKFHHELLYRRPEALARLAATRVTLCGAGALGSHLADNLVRQGCGPLRVIDRDRIELHNVSTQLYGEADGGGWKVEVLRNRIFRAAGVEVEAVAKELAERNARSLLKGSGLVVDAFDNSASRRLVQEFCRELRLPCLHVGLFTDYAEVVWDEHYRVPADVAGDVCDYPLGRNLVLLAVAVASETLVRFVVEGVRQDWSVTLRDLAVRPLEMPG